MSCLPTCPNANHPYSVLFVKADGGNQPTVIRDALLAQPNVGSVDVFDAFVGTPTLAELSAYDIVLPYSNTDYQDAVTLGDNLAAYTDAGGVVITLAFEGTTSPNRTLAGRWLDGDYRLWQPGMTVSSGNNLLGAFDGGHPLMKGVGALGAYYRIADLTLAPGATQVAAWSDGPPLVAYKGRAVGVNARLGSEEWSGDFARLIVNAADWLYPHPVEPPVVAPDNVKPSIARLRLAPKTFKAARRGAKKGGTRVRFRLSEAATVRLTVQRRKPGRKARWRTLEGGLSHVGAAGANNLRFTGRLRGRKLKAGRYRLVAVATDAAGNRSKVSRKAFRIVKPVVKHAG